MKIEPFDIEKVKNGAKLVTRDGRFARIVCYDAKGSYPIIALTDSGTGEEDPHSYAINGQFRLSGDPSDLDLFIVCDCEPWRAESYTLEPVAYVRE